jgi:hypothetical protein
MLANYRRKANIAAAVWFVAMFALIPLAHSAKPGANIWSDGNLIAQLAFLAFIGAWFYGLWAYLKAKGRSGSWAVLGVFTLIGLIIILALSDKHKGAENVVPE